MLQYMEKTVFTHQIPPHFSTNGILLNQRAWFTAKDIPSNSPDTYNLCMQKVQRKFTELTGGGMK